MTDQLPPAGSPFTYIDRQRAAAAAQIPDPETDPAPVDQGHEIAYLLALLAVLWPSFIAPEYPGQYRLVIALPTGHASWPVAARDLDLFDHVLPIPAEGMPADWIIAGPAVSYRRIWDLTIARLSISEQAAGARAAERSRLRGALEPARQLINTSDGPASYVPWSAVEVALVGAAPADGGEAAAGGVTAPV